MAFDTVANIVSNAAVELGLGSVSDVFASTDPNIMQMRTLLKSAGRKLVRERRWSHLVLEHTFTTSAAASYALPTDFRCMVPQTGWDRSNVWPLALLDGEQWQYIAAGGVLTVRLTLRFWKNAIYVEPSTDTGNTIAFEYGTVYWCAATGSTTPTLDGPSANTDVVLFDPDLAQAALKLAWLKAKGFDPTAAQNDYDRALSAASRDDAQAQIHPIGSNRDFPYIDGRNIPDTGIG